MLVPDSFDEVELDDEAVFWQNFFNRLQPFRNSYSKFKTTISSTFLGEIYDTLGQLYDDISDTFSSISNRVTELTYSTILRSPGSIIAILLLSTILIGKDALDFEHQINGDVEIYLPDGADSTILLENVREQWATDIVILYIQTNNAASGSEKGAENITDVEILSQISRIEGDDNNVQLSGYQRGLDYDKSDRGTNDGVIWILSPAQMIKEANSSNYRFSCAAEKYGLPTGNQDECTFASLNPFEGYSIPQGDDAQERIDRYVENSGELLNRPGCRSSLVCDTNNDGIWDTGVVVMGIIFDMSNTDIDERPDPKNPQEELRDHKAFLLYVEKLTRNDCNLPENYDLLRCRTYENPTSTMDNERLDTICRNLPGESPYEGFTQTNDKFCRNAITITGLTPVLHDVSDAIYIELVDTMLPLSLLFVALTMFILHRNPKVVIICGLPIMMSLAVTFGTTVIADIMLTPMIISAGPILVGLGVDYALHLTNRIEENRSQLIAEHHELSWKAQRDGLQTKEIDPWNSYISLAATVRSAKTTGHAIFLSALTTIVGFSVLTWTEIVPIEPMRTVGTTLLLGIASTFILSMLMVPALVHILRYRRGEIDFELTSKQIWPSAIFISLCLYIFLTRFLDYVSNLNNMDSDNAFLLSFSLCLVLLFSFLPKLWDKIGEIPLKATILILLVAGAVTLGGISIFSEELGKDITGSSDEVPPGLESYESLREYSIEFKGGQTNMFIVDASNYVNPSDSAPIRDLSILDAIEDAQVNNLDNIRNTSTISLVNILKAVHVDVEFEGFELYDQSLWELLHDECWDESNNPIRPDCWAYSISNREDIINIVFDTLSPEIRSMLMNADTGIGETKTLVYVNQPYINLGAAASLRDSIDSYLTGDGCISALDCDTLGINGVSNSLLTGGLPVSLDINKGIHDAQSDSTIATMLILLFIMSLLFRSPRLSIFTMIAVGAVVLWQPILMKLGSVNVNVFTAMIGTIVFGIGVDDSIHIVDRIKDERETPSGIVTSISRTGHTIFETTATTCAGLSAGLFVAIPGLQNFFILMMLLLVLALLTSSILLPTMIVAYNEFKSRITGNGTWLDYESSGTLALEPTMDAVVHE